MTRPYSFVMLHLVILFSAKAVTFPVTLFLLTDRTYGAFSNVEQCIHRCMLYLFPMSRFEWIELGMTPLLTNQPVSSKSERARDQCQSAAVTLLVKLSFSFLSRVSRPLNYFIAIDS